MLTKIRNIEYVIENYYLQTLPNKALQKNYYYAT